VSSVGGIMEPSHGTATPLQPPAQPPTQTMTQLVTQPPGRLIPLRPLTISDVLDLSFQVLRRLGAPLAVLVFAILVPEQLLREVIGVGLQPPATVDPADIGAAFTNLGWLLVSSFIGFYVGLVISAAIVALLATRERGLELSVGPSLRIGLGRSGATLGASLMLGVGAVIVFIPVLLLGTLVAVVLPVVGIVLFIPIVLFVPLVGFLCSVVLVAVAVEEGTGPWKTLTRTLALVRSGFWRSVLITLLLWLVILGVVAGLFVGGALLSMVLGDLTWTLQVLGGAVLTTVSTPLLAAAGLVLYRDLRVRSEAFDLVTRTRALRSVRA
jgi:hypothetical protein